jgi:hypothetical protein
MALGDGSFQVHFSFVALQGSSSSVWKNLQCGISNTAFDIATYKVRDVKEHRSF